MIRVCLLRHGTTEWNQQHRIQGRTDIGLTPETVQQFKDAALPPAITNTLWFSSPLVRATQTAKLLSGQDPVIDKRLTEMHWGTFEGMHLKDIETRIVETGQLPATGLDFLPPGGESPRMVSARLQNWCKQLVEAPSPESEMVVAVTHKGVIRAALHLATGWQMQDKFRPNVNWHMPVCFSLDENAGLHLDSVNCPFDEL